MDQIKKVIVPVKGGPPKTVYRVLLGLYIDGVVTEARVFEEADLGLLKLQAGMQRFADEIIGQPKSVKIPSGIQPVQLPNADE